MTNRSYERNSGLIATSDIVADDKWVVGAVIITIDEDGAYAAVFKSEDMDGLPAPDVQETLGGFLASAFEIANLAEASKEDQ